MRRVLITGGASGIGAATVTRFQEDGCLVAALDIDEAALALSTAEVKVHCNVADEASVAAAVEAAVAELGGLDVVVAAAGVASRGSVEHCSPEEFGRVMSINVRGVYLTCRATVPHLRAAGGGAVVTVASQLGLVAVADAVAYCASKGGVSALTRALATEYDVPIRICAVAPGGVETNMYAAFVPPKGADWGRMRKMSRDNVEVGKPAELASFYAYLGSDEARYVSGATLMMDGGISC